MADLEKVLGDILQNPDSLGKIKELISNTGSQSEQNEQTQIDPEIMFKVTKAVSAMSDMKTDSRARLLYDLKPYISGSRRKRVDEAVQILGLLRVMDILGKE